MKNGMVILLILLAGCSMSSFGKFQVDDGIPTFIQVGTTTKAEVLKELGEPLVHRIVMDRETMIYNHEQGQYFVIFGTYEGHELIIRFTDEVISDAKIEQTGSGWGWMASATSNNPGTRRSAR